MKIRIFTTALTALAALVAIWCVVSPEFALELKIGISVGIALLYVISFHFDNREFQHLITNGTHKITNLSAQVYHCLLQLIETFTSWAIEADLSDVETKRNVLFRNGFVCPIQHVVRWADLSAVFSCIGFTILGAIYCHYHNFAGLVILNLTGFVVVHLVSVIAEVATTAVIPESHLCSGTGAVIATLAILAQLCVTISQLALTALNWIFMEAPSKEIIDGPAYLPYFTIRLGFINFTLSPLQAIVVACAVLFLFCYGNLCAATHRLSTYPIEAE